MRIVEISALIVRLRLRKEFKHASYRRQQSDNLIVRCRLSDGTIGWGEGVPREYVTGESATTALEQLAASNLAEQLQADCTNWPDVIRLCQGYQPTVLGDDPRGCAANAHRCAVEISILDAFGKVLNEPLRNLVRHVPGTEEIRGESTRVQYSSAISSGSNLKEMLSSLAMRVYGFGHCKVKVGMQPDRDGQRLRQIRLWVGRKMDLRVDANEAWSPEETVGRIAALQPHRISCVEQPVRHEDVAALAEIRRQVQVPIMLDESLTSIPDAEVAIREGTCDLFNLRLSKCGGFLASFRLAAMAAEAGLGYQLGCHPGESAILSAAGRHFVTSIKNIRYREGSADRHLLKDSISDQDLTFGRGGWAPALNAPGLGITINDQQLRPLVIETRDFPIL